VGGTKKTAELTLFAKVDQQMVQRSIQHLRQLEKAEDGVSAAASREEYALGEVDEAVRRNINAVRLNITTMRQDVENRRRAIQSLDQEAVARKKVAQAADKQADSTARAARQGGQTADGTDFGRVSRGVGSAAQVLPGGAGDAARALADVLGVLDDVPVAVAEIKPALAGLTGSIGSLAAAGAAGIALAALAIAIQQFAKQIQEAQARLDTAFEARLKTNELILTATNEEIEAQLESLEARRLAIETTLAEAQAARNAAEAGWSFEAALASLAEMLGITISKSEREAKKELEGLNAEIDALRAAASSSQVQARSAAQAAQAQVTQTQTATRAEEQRTKVVEKATVAIDAQRQSLALFYENLTERARESTQEAAQAERDLVMERSRIFADYAERITEQERQSSRERAREARRAEYDRRRAEIEGRDDALRLALDRDFAGLAQFNRQEQRNGALDQLDAEFAAKEKLIAQREQDQDNRLALQRQLNQLTERAAQTRAQQMGSELDAMRQQVAEWLRLRGIMVDANRLTEEQIRKWYQIAVAMGSVPQTQFGARPGGGAANVAAGGGSAPAASFGGRSPAAGAGGGFSGAGGNSSTVNAGGVNISINGAQKPDAIAREVTQAIDAYFRGINR
jgi:hypothetical protein